MSDNKNNNLGCFIIVALYIIGNVIYFFNSHSKEDLAETGQEIMFIASIAIAVLIFRKFRNKNENNKEILNNNDKNENIGCLKMFLIALCFISVVTLIFLAIGNNFQFNVGIGILVAIIFAIIVAALLWNSIKD